MSYRIEYQWASFVLDATVAPGLPEPRYVIAIEAGSNNLTETDRLGRERRVRDWEIGMIGTKRQVLRQATRFASECEGGMLKPRGRSCSPESYIRRIRRLLARPSEPVRSLDKLRLSVDLPDTHPLAKSEGEPGFVYYAETRFGRDRVKLIPLQPASYARYFELIDPYLDDFSILPFSAGEVFSMPRS
jgi:hypothetical protein